MLEYKSLEGMDIEMLHRTFVEAFSDYQVKIELPLWKFRQMLLRRGYNPEYSIGAFKDGILVGFIINGCREWMGKPTAYDNGTGVVPEYRKQGLTTNMFFKASEMLKARGVEQYLLEVIRQNTAAYELYKKLGFEITRSFTCYRLERSRFKAGSSIRTYKTDGFTDAEWEQVKAFHEIEPSWQNSVDSIRSNPGSFTYLSVRSNDRIIGYGIMERNTGDIPQFGVAWNFRGQGIGRSIIAGLINDTEAERAAVINVDDRSSAVRDFLIALGFEKYVEQYEMILDMKA